LGGPFAVEYTVEHLSHAITLSKVYLPNKFRVPLFREFRLGRSRLLRHA
jgi:hypothetical protein